MEAWDLGFGPVLADWQPRSGVNGVARGMRSATLKQPIKAMGKDIAHVVETSRDVMKQGKNHAQAKAWNRQAARVAISTAAALTWGAIAWKTLSSLRRMANEHHHWKKMDKKLDAALEDAGNTSEPTAMY